MTDAAPYHLSNSNRHSASGIFLGSIGAAGGVFLICLWATTQYTAHQLGYQAALGEPLFWLRDWPIYEPWLYFWWLWRFGEVPGTDRLWSHTVHFLIIVSHCLIFVAIGVAILRAKRLSRKTDTHGSARWAIRKEIRASGLLSGAGVYIGGWQDRRTLRYLRHDGPEHVLAFAPSRSGKGVGLVIPTLLTWPESAVIHDIKGELWALTAGWRKQQGQVCLRFDPTSTNASRYNPLLEVRRGPYEVRDAQQIADILVDPEGDGRRDHWDLTAYELLVAVILYVLQTRQDKTLAGCLSLLTDPQRPLYETLKIMLQSPQPVVAGTARAVLDKGEDERSSVVSTAIRCLSLFRDPLIAGNTEASDFALSDLMHHDRPVSLYLTVPTSDISRTRPLVRLLLNQLGRRLTETMHFADGQPVAHYRHRLLLMLDEFPALGKLEFFQTSLAYLAGYGVKCYLIAQDLSQLYAAYGRHESIISNCHIRVAFAPNKVETAKLISDMAGQMTVRKQTRTYTGSRLQPVLMHVIAAEQESSRPLLAADEALRLREDDALIFVSGMAPIYGRKLRYYLDPVFSERAGIAAPATQDGIAQPESLWTVAEETPKATVHQDGADLL